MTIEPAPQIPLAPPQTSDDRPAVAAFRFRSRLAARRFREGAHRLSTGGQLKIYDYATVRRAGAGVRRFARQRFSLPSTVFVSGLYGSVAGAFVTVGSSTIESHLGALVGAALAVAGAALFVLTGRLLGRTLAPRTIEAAERDGVDGATTLLYLAAFRDEGAVLDELRCTEGLEVVPSLMDDETTRFLSGVLAEAGRDCTSRRRGDLALASL
ncbi:MAG: hypothetical protein AAF467_14710 [Actinomycetota bacterium]